VSEIDPKLSRAYREASREEPPAALDAAILAAAKQQAATPRRPARASWVRWMAPASALATLLVGVSVALLMQREQPEIIDDTAVRPSAPRPQRPQPEGTSETAKAKAADRAAERKEAPAAAASAPALAPPLPAAKSPAQVPAPVVQAPRSAEAAPPAAQAFPAESRAKVGAPAMARESNVAGDSASAELGAAAPAAAGKLAPQRSPEAWLEEIKRLKREGRDKEAAEQLAEFRKAYPAYAVPESLRGLQ